MKTLFLGLSFLILTVAGAHAHAMVERANIVEGASYTPPPEAFEVTFIHEVALAAVTIETSLGETVDIGFAPDKAVKASFRVPLPVLAPADYILSWRALAKDGHVMAGKIHFTVE
ncbi:MAG: copper resistance protein CopC [Alphaproteobacteria bacterium]|nr:copper resistance protein CopC [Alphaproteobacteria bacterium]